MRREIIKGSILPSLATYYADHFGMSPTEDAWLRKCYDPDRFQKGIPRELVLSLIIGYIFVTARPVLIWPARGANGLGKVAEGGILFIAGRLL